MRLTDANSTFAKSQKKELKLLFYSIPNSKNRTTDALAGLSENEIVLMDQLLTKVLINCKMDQGK
jgi:hypothetical protein